MSQDDSISRWEEGHSANTMLTEISVFLANKIRKTFAASSQKRLQPNAQ